MNTKTLANIALLLVGTALTVLLLYGVVGLAELWAESNFVSVTPIHKFGITVLGLNVALLLTGSVVKLIFQSGGSHLHLSEEDVTQISAALSIFHPIKGLLDTKTLVDYATFELRLIEFCEAVDKKCHINNWKKQAVKELFELVKTNDLRYRSHLTLGVGMLSDIYRWLPQPTDWLRMISKTTDLGVLGQILVYIRQYDPELAEVAMLRYEDEIARSPLAHRKVAFDVPQLIQQSLEVERSRITRGTCKTQKQGRQRDDLFRDYEQQIRQVA